MNRYAIAAFALMLASAGAPALAQGKHACPPGLAKKSTACVPPGQAKKTIRPHGSRQEHKRLRPGERYDHTNYRYERVTDWRSLGLPPLTRNQGYYRDGGMIYRIDEDTRRVLALYELARILGER